MIKFGAGAPEATAGPDGDPDEDGRCNFLEYALGTDPVLPDVSTVPPAAVEGAYLTLRFPRLKTATDLSYSAEISSNLTVWQSGSDVLAIAAIADQGSTELVTIRDRAAANNFTKRFVRMRVAQLPPGTSIPAPTDLTASALSISAIRLHWKYPSLDARTFTIERLIPGPDWTPLGTVAATTLTFLDSALLAGATYTYRVVASNSALTSPASNLASATTLTDGDFDGIDDDDESTYGTDPNNPDTDGDGISDGDELALGTDPANDDTDGDGIPDGADKFPTDDRRSDHLPVKHYGVIDLSEGLNLGPNDAHLITTNDTGNVAFNTIPQQPVANRETRIIVWGQGNVMKDTSFWLRQVFEPPPFTPEVLAEYRLPGWWWSGYPTGVEGLGERTITDSRTVLGLDVDGSIVGFAHRKVDGIYPFIEPPEAFFGAPTQLGFAIDAAGSERLLVDDETYGVNSQAWYAARANGKSIGGVNVHVDPANPSYQTKLVLAVDDPVRPEDPPSGDAASSDGRFVKTGNQTIWDTVSRVAITLPAGTNLSAVNDQGQGVGDLDSVDENGFPLGMFWDGSSRHTFQALLPAKFQKQIRSAIPRRIANAVSPTVSPLVYFAAETLEGGGFGAWVEREFLWWSDASGTPHVARVRATLDGVEIDLDATALAADGSMTGTKLVAGAVRPLLGQDVQFRADDIRRGFDLPIEGDKEPPLTGDDSNHPEWWTKVARAPGSAHNSHVNSNVRVIFKSAAAAANYRVVVPTSSQSVIDVSPSPTATLDQETQLTITGKNPAPGDQRREAEIHIKRKAGDANVTKLRVDLLPVRKIKLGIYFVKGWSAVNSDIPADFKIAGTIIARLNEIFQQACVEFEVGLTGDIVSGFDLDGDDALDCGQYSVEKNIILRPQNLPLPDKLNLLIVRNISDDFGSVGVTPTTDNPDRSVVETLYFETAGSDRIELFLTTCAHEIGHALGLSTRNRSLSEGHPNYRHDSGAYPSTDYHLDGTRVNDPSSTAPRMDGALMKKETGKWRWMRHQDWKKANENARPYATIP